VEFIDGVYGPQRQRPGEAIGDFVLLRGDGVFAYQLAVVVDDAAMGITEVVRGHDLLGSTPRQLLLYRALGLPPPRFAHVPLVVGSDGARLAKRHGAVSLAELRASGLRPSQLVSWLAASLGLGREGNLDLTPRDLVEDFHWDRLSREPATWAPAP
jgi:glutamyl-tRNA synthetase